MSVMSEFKKFAIRGNVVDMALSMVGTCADMSF